MGYSKITLDLLMKLWPLGKAVNWLGRQPLVGALFRPFFSREENEAIIIPVQEVVHQAGSVVLPYSLLAPLVDLAGTRFILNECLCRRGEGCRAYPHDVGCLFLGDGAAEISPSLGRRVGVDGALHHLRRAMALGLVPLIAHASFDALVLGIPYRRMLAVCFCCDCCCAVRQSLRNGQAAFWETVVRLPGLSLTVGPECVQCGACLDVCHVGAIFLDNGRVGIEERCKGCGRCVAVCPHGALSLRLDEGVDTLDRLLARIEQRTDIKPAAT